MANLKKVVLIVTIALAATLVFAGKTETGTIVTIDPGREVIVSTPSGTYHAIVIGNRDVEVGEKVVVEHNGNAHLIR